MLGHDVVRAAGYVNHELVALGHAKLDVTDEQAVRGRFIRERPDAVVNCAALADVDRCEEDQSAARALNVDAARTVAAAAAEVDASVVHLSTDYVFDGAKREPYVESDEPRPLSVYGRTKLEGEHEVAAANPRHMVIRTSWLFGSGRRNFVDEMLSLGRDLGEVTAVRDQVSVATYTGHLADAIVRLVEAQEFAAYGLQHIAAYGECSRFDLAQEIFRQAGIDCRVLSTTAGEQSGRAPRPPYSAMATERDDTIYLPEWQQGLGSYLAERAVAA